MMPKVEGKDCKRRGPGKKEAASQETPPSEKDTKKTEEPTAEVKLDVYGLLRWFISALNAHAWQTMGLVADPQTQKIEKDLAQARTAIDCVEFLIEKLKGHASESEMRELQTLLANLRVNFVNQSSQEK